MVGDIRNYEVCLKACEGIQVVVHLAASTGVPQSIENPRRDMEMNVIGTFNMLEASQHLSPYGASKLAGEAYCYVYYRTFGLKTVVLRFGNVYGPRSKHKSSVIAKFFKRALAGEPLEIYGDGNQTHDFIYIDDLLQANF